MAADTAKTERGMESREQWTKGEVHKASTYACGKCGKGFDSPHDFYAHLDAEHPKGGRHGRRAR
jgi:hypothetical protein